MIQPLPSLMCMVAAHVSLPDKPPTWLPAELDYTTTDPYAVRLTIGAPGATAIDWVFARSLLFEGLRQPCGAGNVLVTPRHPGHPDTIRIVLRSPSGAALVDIASLTVAIFLERTASLVPLGTESLHIDMDRVITELTDKRD